MADEHDQLHNAAAALDNRILEKPKKSNVAGNDEAETLPEDMTEVPDRRDPSASRNAT